jgi:hypothetical protein
LFDINQTLLDEGIEEASADVVVANNVLHVAADLEFTLGSLRAAFGTERAARRNRRYADIWNTSGYFVSV